MPDEARTNVYKLYRATRCDPDSSVDATKQIALYDAGLGTDSGSNLKITWARRLQNLFSQMTGWGISTNIIDCYANIISVWEPEDRIYLFGFSRGAYTVRCLGGVLGMCGIPAKAADGTDLKLDPSSIRAVATEAVRHVYEHGLTTKHPRFGLQRKELAKRFRENHQSYDGAEIGAVPYFIGVWDTVAALSASTGKLLLFLLLLLLAVMASAAVAALALASAWWILGMFIGVVLSAIGQGWLAPDMPPFWEHAQRSFLMLYLIICAAVFATGLFVYLRSHLKFSTKTGQSFLSTIHLIVWKLRFYDRSLDTRVRFARHAMSIDEYRKDFARVGWGNLADQLRPAQNGEPEQLQQIWFAGNHADIGGGYPESESRLSDIALQWMVDFVTKELPPEVRVLVDDFYLRLSPSADGIMHDECKSGIGGHKRLKWAEERRLVPRDAVLHRTVYDRLELKRARSYDGYTRYRPEPLRTHNEAGKFF